MTVDSRAQNQASSGLSTLDNGGIPALDTVIRDIFDRGAQYGPLTETEEADLLERAKNFDEAASLRLIYAYAPTLRNAVGKTTLPDGTRRRVMDDMQAAAVSAVWEAIAAHGTDDNDLAWHVIRCVRASVHDAESVESTITIPGRTLRRFYSILEKEDGDVFAAAKIAPDFGMTEEVFLSVAAARYLVELPDVTPAAHDDYLTFEEHDLAHFALRSIDGLERTVTEYRHGFITGEPMSPEAIADELSRQDVGTRIYRRKVARLEESALRKMRAALAVGEEVPAPAV